MWVQRQKWLIAAGWMTRYLHPASIYQKQTHGGLQSTPCDSSLLYLLKYPKFITLKYVYELFDTLRQRYKLWTTTLTAAKKQFHWNPAATCELRDASHIQKRHLQRSCRAKFERLERCDTVLQNADTVPVCRLQVTHLKWAPVTPTRSVLSCRRYETHPEMMSTDSPVLLDLKINRHKLNFNNTAASIGISVRLY